MNKLLALLLIGIWIGLVLGLSFIEAPLKFQAPGITTQLGLGIGRIVFGVLNKIEIVFSLLLLLFYVQGFRKMNQVLSIAFPIVFLVVFIQSAFLFPVLNERTDLILSGQTVAPSKHHLIYIFLEVAKLITLLVVFVKTYRLETT